MSEPFRSVKISFAALCFLPRVLIVSRPALATEVQLGETRKACHSVQTESMLRHEYSPHKVTATVSG